MTTNRIDYAPVEKLIAEADQYGLDCNDSEASINELAAQLRKCWAIMTPEQRLQLLAPHSGETQVVSHIEPTSEKQAITLEDAKRRAADSTLRYDGLLTDTFIGNTASAFIYASTSFDDGEAISTSEITKIGTDNGLPYIETNSRSRYLVVSFLDESAVESFNHKIKHLALNEDHCASLSVNDLTADA